MRNNKREQRQQIAVRLMQALGALLTLCFILGGFGAPAGVIVAMATTGTLIGSAKEADGPDSLRVPSVTEVITRVEPSRFAFTTLLDRIPRVQPAKQIVHRWHQASRLPRMDTVPSATTAGAAAGAKTVGVSNGAQWRKNDIFIAPDNLTSPSGVFLITAVSVNNLTVYALPAASTGNTPYAGDALGTVPAFAEGEKIYWIGNSKTERDTKSDSRGIVPAPAFNLVHTHDATVDISDHKMRSENFGTDEWLRLRKDNLYEFRKSREYMFCFNEAATVSVDPVNNKVRWTMRGLKGFLTQTVTLQHSSGVPTQSNVVDFIYSLFDDNGSNEKMLVGGSDILKAIDKSTTGDLWTKRSEKIAGVTVEWLEGRKGHVGTIFHPGFDEMGFASASMVLDFNHIMKRDYQAMEKRDLLLKETGEDAEGEYYIEKTTLEVRNPEAHYWAELA